MKGGKSSFFAKTKIFFVRFFHLLFLLFYLIERGKLKVSELTHIGQVVREVVARIGRHRVVFGSRAFSINKGRSRAKVICLEEIRRKRRGKRL